MMPDEILTYKVEEARACKKTVSGPRWLWRWVRALQFFSITARLWVVWGLGAYVEFGGTCSDDLKWSVRTCSYKLSIGPLLVLGTLPIWLPEDRAHRMRELARKGKLGTY